MNPSRSTKDYVALVRALCRPDGESEWVEYKRNRVDPAEIGQYISALANAAALTLFARRHFKEMSRANKIRAVYQHASLRYVMGQKTTNATLRERFGISSANSAVVSRLLGDALKAGAIIKEDEAAGPRNRAYLPFWAGPTE